MKQGWEYKKLGEVCYPKNKIQRATKCFDTSDKIFYIDISSIDNTIQKMTDVISVTFGDAPSRAQQKVEYGDIIVSTVRPNLKNIAIIDRYESNLVASSGFCVLRNTEHVERNYLYHYITSDLFTQHLMKLTTGANYPAVRDQDVRDSIIPIPPKSIQLAIVSELDKINELIRLKKEQLKDYDNLAQSIFYEMFGDPVENEKGFDTKRLDEVFPLITDGTHQTPTYTEDRENGYKFLSAKDVTSGSINWNNVKFIPAWLHDNLSKRLKPQKNDILLCKNGTTGICALVEDDDTFDIYVSLALLRPNNLHNPKYLTYAINSPATKRQFDDSLKGIGVPNLHLKEIRRTIIIIPPLPLQHLFAQRIEQIERQKSAVQQSITDLETLLASRMQYWFE